MKISIKRRNEIARLYLVRRNQIDEIMIWKFFGDIDNDTLNEIAWDILILRGFHEGIKIGSFTKREVSNEVSKINVSCDEGMAFASEVIKAVAERISNEL